MKSLSISHGRESAEVPNGVEYFHERYSTVVLPDHLWGRRERNKCPRLSEDV